MQFYLFLQRCFLSELVQKNDSSVNSNPTTTTDKTEEENDISKLIGTWYYDIPDSEFGICLYIEINADSTISTYIEKDEANILNTMKDDLKEACNKKGITVEEFLENSGYATLDDAAKAALKDVANSHDCADINEYFDKRYKQFESSGTFKKISSTEISVNSDGEETVYKFNISENKLTIFHNNTTYKCYKA